MVETKKGLKDKVGEEKYQNILDKEWKVADLPAEEELAAEKHESPKARNNPNSRKNLVQYQKKKSRATKKKIVDNLNYTEHEDDIDPLSILSGKIDVKLLQTLMPAADILESRQEQEMYWNTINLFLGDFDMDSLTSSDISDVINVAINEILKFRLLKGSRGNSKNLMEAMNAIDKLQKYTEKLKSGLAGRRVDRVDVKNKSSFSIVDLAALHDGNVKREFEERTSKLLAEEAQYKKDKLGDG